MILDRFLKGANHRFISLKNQEMNKSIKSIKNLIPRINIGNKNVKTKNLKLFNFSQFFKIKINVINENITKCINR